MKRSIKILATTIFCGIVFFACKGDGENESPDGIQNVNSAFPAQIASPANNDAFFVNDKIDVKIKINDPENISDLELYVNDELFKGNLSIEDQTISVPTADARVGGTKIFLSYKDGSGKERGDNRNVILFSDIEPEYRTASIVQTYAHAKSSYTQGLEFYKGKLFEGTGQYNRSILAEVDLSSGTVLRQHNLDGSIFGEGITILNDTIYQITYKSQICYVYDMDFNLLNTFSYHGEGWGLCNDGKHLIMSNGSGKVVWRDPNTFEVVKTLPVFDDQTEVVNINELELINGNLFANLYTESIIAEIDTSNGKVISYIDCIKLVTDASEPGNDVLNGIAQNPETGKIYMTGKLWSKLYEVSFE